jgi:hypothetical protein
LNFARVENVQIEGRRRWLGCAQSDGTNITFYGTGDDGIWMSESRDGGRWSSPEILQDVRGADPGVVTLRDGSRLVVATGPPRPDTASARQRAPFREGGPPPRGEPIRPRGAADPPRREPTAGIRELEVDAGKRIGEIRSLLGVNRGPFSYARRPGEETVSHVDSYRRLGIDFIRTHDFYGPTDWHVIFRDWSADPGAPASYDFASSDARIQAIVTNGFRCFYRMGTSWKGRRLEPINDPPGTIRDQNGRITHRADRNDFKKWAAIAAATVRHYTQGWNHGFRHSIGYWEIWNEPDLAAQFWTGTPQQYYQLYEEAARALKAVNPELKVGGPACTGGLQPAYLEEFIDYCREHGVPLDFFSWHSYGGRGEFNPYQFRLDAERIRQALDRNGFTNTETIITEWNAGIQSRLFNHTVDGAAFYASTLACLLDAGVNHAFQYCGDRHPGLGMHEFEGGDVKVSACSFVAWKRLLETPERIAARGSDEQGYNVVAGRSADGRRVRVLISDFQSAHDAFRLRISGLPWRAEAPVQVTRWLLDDRHSFDVVETMTLRGAEIAFERPFRSGSVCLVEIERQ